MNPIHAVAGAASLAGQVAYLPVATVQNLMHNYNEINESTLSGAIDIVAVRQPDGCLKSTPFHVRFGRLQVVKPRDKVVTVRVNGVEVALKMKLGRSGEAYFVREADVSDESELDSDLAVSPIQSPRRASLSGSSTEASDVVTPPDSDTTHRDIDALKEQMGQLRHSTNQDAMLKNELQLQMMQGQMLRDKLQSKDANAASLEAHLQAMEQDMSILASEARSKDMVSKTLKKQLREAEREQRSLSKRVETMDSEEDQLRSTVDSTRLQFAELGLAAQIQTIGEVAHTHAAHGGGADQ